MGDTIKSKLQAIEKGFPDWNEPLMANLYLLEDMINNITGGESNEEILKEIEQIKENIKELENSIGESNITDIEKQLQVITKDIENIKSLIIELDIETVSKELEEIKEEQKDQRADLEDALDLLGDVSVDVNGLKTLSKDIPDMKEDINTLETGQLKLNQTTQNNTQAIANMQPKVANLLKDMTQVQEEIQNILAYEIGGHYIVDTFSDLGNVENVSDASFGFVRNSKVLYIYDGAWKAISSGTTGGSKIAWEDIIDRPESTPLDVDKNTKARHIHLNQDVLNLITNSKVSEWDNKPDEVPTKLSDLEDDMNLEGLTSLDKQIDDIEENLGDVNLLETDDKSSVVYAVNEVNKNIQELKQALEDFKKRVTYIQA